MKYVSPSASTRWSSLGRIKKKFFKIDIYIEAHVPRLAEARSAELKK